MRAPLSHLRRKRRARQTQLRDLHWQTHPFEPRMGVLDLEGASETLRKRAGEALGISRLLHRGHPQGEAAGCDPAGDTYRTASNDTTRAKMRDWPKERRKRVGADNTARNATELRLPDFLTSRWRIGDRLYDPAVL